MQSENNTKQTLPGINDLNLTGLLPFNFRNLGGDYLITNDLGESHYLKHREFSELIRGELDIESELYSQLKTEGFVKGAFSDLEYREKYWAKRAHLFAGPSLHSFVLVDSTGTKMSTELVEKGVEFAFDTTSSEVVIEFRGEGSLSHWEGLVHCVAVAKERSGSGGKALSFSLVNSLNFMDEEKLDFLIENKIQVCAVLDAPQAVGPEDTSKTTTLNWVKRIHQRYEEGELAPERCRVELLQTIRAGSYPYWREIVDTCVDAGCRTVFLSGLSSLKEPTSSGGEQDSSVEEFLEFYGNMLDYILQLNKDGVEINEQFAATMSSQMIGGSDPGYLSLRHHRGPVLGQLAYSASGHVYSSYEGLQVAATGDEFFQLGELNTLTYAELMKSPQAKALIMGASRESLPGVEDSCYKPYLAPQPEYNYVVQGSIQGRMPESPGFKRQRGVFDYLAKRMNTDDDVNKIFERWSVASDRSYFIAGEEKEAP